MKPGEPQPGWAAKWSDICPRCDESINRGDRVVKDRGRMIHTTCARGNDE